MDGAVDVTTYWAEFILAVGGAATVLIGALRWSMRSLERKIKDEIRSFTEQIQPGWNGGLSLTDLHKKVDLLIERVAATETRQRAAEDRFDAHIDHQAG